MLFIVLPLVLLVAGSAVGLAMLGFVKIPFLPFGKKKVAVKAPKDDGKGGPFASYLTFADSVARQAEMATPAKLTPRPSKPDTGPGEAKLAALWAEMPADRLAAIVGKWPEAQLGRILALMDSDAVTGLLAGVPPGRGAALTLAVAGATDESAAKVHMETKK